MDPERYTLVKRLALAARDLPAAEREAFLERECGDDPELRAEITSLLPHDSSSPEILEDGALERDIQGVLDAVPDGVVPAEIPDHIGPWEVVGVLGEGGMGIVYRAKQEKPIRREVALKLIRRGLDTDRVVARFESERQALARMEHPGIARVLDAGADAAGRPFFVMELVDGRPITAYCVETRLDVRARLELFLKVCHAVRHAHRKGIIHRDIKPSNVLVSVQDGRPEPKIIDFGIAKATDQSATDQPALTQEGHLIGTPEYMSPEQAEGSGNVDTRTDVYSLGVLLYEILTGKLPYHFDTHRYREIQRVLREEAPKRPSLNVPDSPGADRLRRRLAGDLDNIVLAALRKEPDRRYGSVEALEEDIRRHLDGHPVAARPDTWSYRTGKFVRRHRIGAGAAVIVLALLVVFAIVLARKSAEVARERDRAMAAEQLAREEAGRAQTEAATAEQVSDFLGNLFRVSNPSESRGNTVTAREILDRGAERVDEELAGQPEVLGRMLYVLGDTYQSLGLNAQSEETLRRSVAVRREALGPDHPDVGRTLQLISTVLHDRGDYDSSVEAGREALRILTAALGEEDLDVAYARSGLAVSLQAAGEHEEAEEHFRAAAGSFRRLGGEEDADYAWCIMSLAYLLQAKGDLDGSSAMYEKALSIQRRLYREPHPDLAMTLNHLGQARKRAERNDEAEALLT